MAPPAAFAAPTLRVALAVHAPAVTLSCPTGFTVHLPAGNVIFTGKTAEFSVENAAIAVNGKPSNADTLLIQPKGPFRFNKQEYRGVLELHRNEASLDAMNVVPLEEYLDSVVGAEMPRGWPMEALKAQAVIARTYALRKQQIHANDPFDVVATTEDQVYNGLESETPESLTAVAKTRGETITYQGALITAYYHADCGGKTENGNNVFPGDFPYLKSVVCPFGQNSPYHAWSKHYTLAELSARFGETVHDISIVKDPVSAHVVTVVMDTGEGEKTLKGFEFRKLLGTQDIRSTNFSIQETQKTVYVPRIKNVLAKKIIQWVVMQSSKTTHRMTVTLLPVTPFIRLISGRGTLSETGFSNQNPLIAISKGGTLSPIFKNLATETLTTAIEPVKISTPIMGEEMETKKLSWAPIRVPVAVTLTGHGWGHGVGLCQWGARGMALQGYDYKAILHYYYQEVEIQGPPK